MRQGNADSHPEPTQTTAQGEMIPVPTREQVLRDLHKVARHRSGTHTRTVPFDKM